MRVAWQIAKKAEFGISLGFDRELSYKKAYTAIMSGTNFNKAVFK
jgi:hypothetical protein